MMKYLSIIFLLISSAAYAQKTYVIPADSTKLTTVNGTGNELIIENDTRDTLGVLANKGGGRTDFKALRLQQLTDSTFRLLLGTTAQGQTVTIRGTGGGGVSENIYTADGTIPTDTLRMVTVDGTVYFKSGDDLKGMFVGDSLVYFFGTGSVTTPADGASIYNSYFDTLNLEGFIGFHNVYNLGTTLVSYSGMREVVDGSESLFGTFHPVGTSGSTGYYSNWGYTNPVSEEAIGLRLEHGGGGAGFRVLPFSPDNGYQFASQELWRVYDTAGNAILTHDISGNTTFDLSNNNELRVIGATVDNAADSVMMLEGNKLVLREVSSISGGGATIYTASDTLESDRTVTNGGNDLLFSDGGTNTGVFALNYTESAYTDNDILTSGAKVGIFANNGGVGEGIGIIGSGGGGGVTISGTGNDVSSYGLAIQASGNTADVSILLQSSGNLEIGGIPTDNTQDRILVIDSTNNLIRYRQASTLSGGGADSTTFATKAYVDSKDAQWSVTRTADSSNFVFTNGATVTQIKDNGWVLLAQSNVSNTTSVDFTLPAGYSNYMIDMDTVYAASAGAALWLRVGTPTIQSGASDYKYSRVGQFDGAAAFTYQATASEMQVFGTAMPDATTRNRSLSGTLVMHQPSDSVLQKKVQMDYTVMSNTGVYYQFQGWGWYLQSTAYTVVRVMCSTGNIYGGFRLYGMK